MAIQSINPYDGEIVATFTPLTQSELETKISNAQNAFESWSVMKFEERKNYMMKIAELFKNKASEYAITITTEMGKPISEAIAEVNKCALNFEYYAKNGEEIMRPKRVDTGSESYIKYEPLGVILEIMPWNFPFWQAMRIAAPAIMAGNTVLLKHSSNIPLCALLLEKIFTEAGFPKSVFQTVLIESNSVEEVIKDDRIKAVSLTGSEKAGSAVASDVGREIKKSVMELGGSDPFIVFKDASIDQAVETCEVSRFGNCGQICVAAKRILIQSDIYDEFINKFKSRIEALVIGDPMNLKTQIGPMVSNAALIEVDRQVQNTLKLGAKLILGGKRMKLNGNFYEPTILIDVPQGSPAYSEEIFGPVASIIKFDSLTQAIKIANDTRFGLAASVWTKDMEIANRCVNEIIAGSVFVNKAVRSDPRLPTGGAKKSGFGRELSTYGMHEFCNIKSVWIEK